MYEDLEARQELVCVLLRAGANRDRLSPVGAAQPAHESVYQCTKPSLRLRRAASPQVPSPQRRWLLGELRPMFSGSDFHARQSPQHRTCQLMRVQQQQVRKVLKLEPGAYHAGGLTSLC